MSKYYQKSHTLNVPSEDICIHLGLDYLVESKYRGENGPIQASYSGTMQDELGRARVETFQSLNYSLTGDPFSGATTGGFANPATVDPIIKERSYSAPAYYAPIKNRPNLHVITGCQVEKILFPTQDELKIARGILFTLNGKKYAIQAQKEIILAAGAINSPKLLELSGIGDPGLLRSMGIDVVIENPNVGQNLQDHPSTGISFEVLDHVKTLDALNRQEPDAINEAMRAYQATKSGPFSGAALNSFAFMPVVDFQIHEGLVQSILGKYPQQSTGPGHEVEYNFVRSVLSSADKSSVYFFTYAARGDFGGDGSKARNVTVAAEKGQYITIACAILYPLSRGSVHIRSASVADKPIIDPQYYSHPLDLEVHARHLRFIETIIATEPLASLLKPSGLRSPDYSHIGQDLEAAKNYIRRTAISGWHPSGTCSMLPREKGGVVNERLVVHGTRNLRIIDASIMPLITRGNLQTTVYAVAERAADLIKEDHMLD